MLYYLQKIAKQVKMVPLFQVTKDREKTKTSVSSLFVIRHIMDTVPGITVINVGEPDFLVEYLPPAKKKKWKDSVKAVLVSIVVFFGSAFTIMTFNKDAGVEEVFSMIYKLTEGAERSGPGELEIAYSVGLPVGIILFFNHFMRKKIDSDPTPLQVQMRQYEKDVNSAIIENASREGKMEDV